MSTQHPDTLPHGVDVSTRMPNRIDNLHSAAQAELKAARLTAFDAERPRLEETLETDRRRVEKSWQILTDAMSTLQRHENSVRGLAPHGASIRMSTALDDLAADTRLADWQRRTWPPKRTQPAVKYIELEG